MPLVLSLKLLLGAQDGLGGVGHWVSKVATLSIFLFSTFHYLFFLFLYWLIEDTWSRVWLVRNASAQALTLMILLRNFIWKTKPKQNKPEQNKPEQKPTTRTQHFCGWAPDLALTVEHNENGSSRQTSGPLYLQLTNGVVLQTPRNFCS